LAVGVALLSAAAVEARIFPTARPNYQNPKYKGQFSALMRLFFMVCRVRQLLMICVWVLCDRDVLCDVLLVL
jgi:hypothetical protein